MAVIAMDFQLYFSLFLTWLLATLLVRFVSKKYMKPNTDKPVNHPPSPPSLPLIGHLHHLSIILPKCFQTLASRYGPLMRISVGASTSLVVSNAAVAKEVMKTHELNFSYRPDFGAGDYEIYKDSSFFGAGYGTYWRFLKRLCMTELLSAPQLSRFIDIRKEEVMKLLEVVAKCAEGGDAVDLGAELMTMTNNIICRMTMSTRCSGSANDSKKVRKFTDDIVQAAAKMSLGELWGPLKKFDLFGYGRKLRAALMEYDGLIEGIIVEHEKLRMRRDGDGQKERKDMLDILLEICEDATAEVKLTRNNIKCFLLEVFMAGTETTSTALQWTLAEIINHPDVFKKLRSEINAVVGPDRLVEEQDVQNLPYLQAVVKEGLRLHPPSPMILRKSKDECKINGYDVLADSRMVINAYAIMRNPESWENPSEFLPSRFLGSSTTESQNLHYLPFGSGRRACPGSTLASAVMHVMIATLAQCFDWKVKGAEKVDMEEGSGVSAGMAHPLICYPITHLNPLKISSLA